MILACSSFTSLASLLTNHRRNTGINLRHLDQRHLRPNLRNWLGNIQRGHLVTLKETTKGCFWHVNPILQRCPWHLHLFALLISIFEILALTTFFYYRSSIIITF